MKPLAQRVALVTGASRGIGAATALQLAGAGAHVIATARTMDGLQALNEEISGTGGAATMVALDMADTSGLARLATQVNETFGRLDVLVANAGLLGKSTPVVDVDEAQWNELIAVNLTANWQLIRLFDPLLRKSNAGRAVFITSGLARRRVPGVGVYAATKAALNALVQIYAAELGAQSPVRVNLFSPGATRTELYTTAFPATDPQTLPTPDLVAAKIVSACLPSLTQHGQLFDFKSNQWLMLDAPAEPSPSAKASR